MSNIITFINHVGQSIIGEQVEATKDTLSVKNPAVIHVSPSQTGQLQVQLIPLFFKEFVSDKQRADGVTFKFNTNSIVTSDAILDDRINEQYKKIFAPAQARTAPAKDAPVIKLFDD